MDEIPFSIPYVSGNERTYIDEVFENSHFSGNGPFTKRCQEWLEDHFSCNRVLLTHSCTAALEISSLLLDLGPGDEVIVPSFTFVTSASSIMRTGATPVFCEIDPKTMMIDLSDAETRISNRTKAIIPVHYSGFSMNMEELISFSTSNNLSIIEDAAQGLGSSWKGKPLGTFSQLGAVSFHETKNIHSGLGGCLIVNDDSLSERAETIWERGTDRGAFFKGLVDKYSWRELGSSFYPSELQAAFLLSQLEGFEENIRLRKQIWSMYDESISRLENQGRVSILRPIEGVEHNAHMFAIFLKSPSDADRVRLALNEEGIGAVIHYVPLHSSEMGKNLGYGENDLPITMEYSERLLRLPLHSKITKSDVDRITNSLSNLLTD
mgnify:CR=1 FL=1